MAAGVPPGGPQEEPLTGIGVILAGALGAVARYVVDGAVQERWEGAFPFGTFVVNLSGAFVLGLLTGYLIAHASAPLWIKTVAGTGFVGAYTTFSTLTFESFRLLREGARRYALVNLLGGTVAGVLLAALGLSLGGRI